MSIKRKIGAAIGALAMMGGVGLAVAAPASASPQDNNVQTIFHSNTNPRGLGGNLGLYTAPGLSNRNKTLPEGGTLVSDPARSYTEIEGVYAGNGYCVWEELLRYDARSASWIKIGNYEYGKSKPRTLYSLGSYVSRNAYTEALKSDLKIFAC